LRVAARRLERGSSAPVDPNRYAASQALNRYKQAPVLPVLPLALDSGENQAKIEQYLDVLE
jgi:hypothetical protein